MRRDCVSRSNTGIKCDMCSSALTKLEALVAAKSKHPRCVSCTSAPYVITNQNARRAS